MIINNICTPLGLANGTQRTVVGFLYADNNNYEQDNYLLPHYAKENYDLSNGQKRTKKDATLPIVLVKMDGDTYKGDSYDIDRDNIIPISPVTFAFKYGDDMYCRTQVPLILSKYNTIHKVQGLSKDYLVWVLDELFVRGI